MTLLTRLTLLALTTIPYQQFRIPYSSPINTLTLGVDQSGANRWCNSTNGTGSYTCHMPTTALLSYTPGMVLTLTVDTSTSNPSLSIDGLSPVTIRDAATGTLLATVTSGAPHLIYFDGTVFRLII